jgi:hypothetical protein
MGGAASHIAAERYADRTGDRQHPCKSGGIAGVANLVVQSRLLRREGQDHSMVGHHADRFAGNEAAAAGLRVDGVSRRRSEGDHGGEETMIHGPVPGSVHAPFHSPTRENRASTTNAGQLRWLTVNYEAKRKTLWHTIVSDLASTVAKRLRKDGLEPRLVKDLAERIAARAVACAAMLLIHPLGRCHTSQRSLESGAIEDPRVDERT